MVWTSSSPSSLTGTGPSVPATGCGCPAQHSRSPSTTGPHYGNNGTSVLYSSSVATFSTTGPYSDMGPRDRISSMVRIDTLAWGRIKDQGETMGAQDKDDKDLSDRDWPAAAP